MPKKPLIKLNTLDTVFLFQTTPMTIYNWRKGSPRKTRPLPCNIGPHGEVSFSGHAIEQWAEENGLELVMSPADYLAAREKYQQRRKPGPKPVKKIDVEERAKTEKARDLARIKSKHDARAASKKPKALGVDRTSAAGRAEFNRLLSRELGLTNGKKKR